MRISLFQLRVCTDGRESCSPSPAVSRSARQFWSSLLYFVIFYSDGSVAARHQEWASGKSVNQMRKVFGTTRFGSSLQLCQKVAQFLLSSVESLVLHSSPVLLLVLASRQKTPLLPFDGVEESRMFQNPWVRQP